MADDPGKHQDEDDGHDGDDAKRYDHVSLLSARDHFLSEEPRAAFSISSSPESRFAPS